MVNILLLPHSLVIVSISLCILLMKIILKRREQLTEKFTWLALGIISTVAIWIFLIDLMYIFDTYHLSLFGFYILTAVSYAIALAAVILLHIFVKFTVQSQLNNIQFNLILGLYSVNVGMLIAYVVLGFHRRENLQVELLKVINVISIFFILFTIIFMQQDFTKLKLEKLSKKQTKQVNFLNYGIQAGLIMQLPIIYVSAFINIFFVLYACFGITIALFFIIQAYSVDPRVSFILPEKTYLLFIADKLGTPLYSKNFMEKDETDETILVSGTLKTITAIMTEFYQVETIPKLLRFNNHLILVHWSEEFYIAVISKQDSHLLYSAMNRLDKKIREKFTDLTQLADPNFESDISQLVQQSFFFIWE